MCSVLHYTCNKVFYTRGEQISISVFCVYVRVYVSEWSSLLRTDVIWLRVGLTGRRPISTSEAQSGQGIKMKRRLSIIASEFMTCSMDGRTSAKWTDTEQTIHVHVRVSEGVSEYSTWKESLTSRQIKWGTKGKKVSLLAKHIM